jgi:hypothetical protein
MSHRSTSIALRSAIGDISSQAVFAPQHASPPGLFLLRAPNDKHSILLVRGFNGTWFVEVADTLPKLANMVDRKCRSFQ